jgi:hypothetical protein
VGDADTLWHPQYLSALTYNGMTMGADERVWKIWQPPILLMRNIFSVPAMTRASSHATLIFELSALANQLFFPAFAYSAYSMTLALAHHPEVDGWDVDVIAEDHHMFCKCYFAALWELAHASKDRSSKDEEIVIRPQVQVEPIFLPAVSYLVESNDYWSSLKARFDQARRHSQGVVELGYVLLQYARLTRATGFFALPWRTHAAIMSIVVKIHTLHITSTAQCFSLIMAAVTTFAPGVIRWILAGGIQELFGGSVSDVSSKVAGGWDAMNFAQQALAASLGQVSGVSVLYSVTCFLVIKDLIEGQYYKVLGQPNILGSMPSVTEGQGDETNDPSEPPSQQTSPVAPPATTIDESDKCKTGDGSPVAQPGHPAVPSFVAGSKSLIWKVGLFFHILHDTICVGYTAITFYAMIPVCLAAWSLFRRGTDFEYIVAEKPEH